MTEPVSDFKDVDNTLYKTIMLMKKELGRMPTEEEIYDFVFGTDEDKARVLADSQK